MASFGNYILDRFLQQYSRGSSPSQLKNSSKALVASAHQAPSTLSRRRKTVKYPWSDSSEDEPQIRKTTLKNVNYSMQSTRRHRRSLKRAKPSCSLVDTYKYSETSRKTPRLDAFLKKYSAETYAKQTMHILNSLSMNDEEAPFSCASKDLTKIHKERGLRENEQILRKRTSPCPETAPKVTTATPKLDKFLNLNQPIHSGLLKVRDANETEKSPSTLFHYFKKSKNFKGDGFADLILDPNKENKFKRKASSSSTDTIRRKPYSQRINSSQSSILLSHQQNAEHKLCDKTRIRNKCFLTSKQPIDLSENIYLKGGNLPEEKYRKPVMMSTTDDPGGTKEEKRKIDSTNSNFNIMLKNMNNRSGLNKSHRQDLLYDVKSKTTAEKRFESLSDFLNESQKRLDASDGFKNPIFDIHVKTIQEPTSLLKFGVFGNSSGDNHNVDSNINISQKTCSTDLYNKYKTTNALTEFNRISTQESLNREVPTFIYDSSEKYVNDYVKSQGVESRAPSINNSGGQCILNSKEPSGSSTGRRMESSEGFLSVNNPTAKKDQKLPYQTLENLFRLHESNNWINQIELSASNKNYDEARSLETLQNIPINSLTADDHQNLRKSNENKVRSKVLTTNFSEKEDSNHQIQYGDGKYSSITYDNQLESQSQEDCVEQNVTEDSGILTQSFTQDTFEKERHKSNAVKRSRKSIKVTSKCILYEDNLLKELLGEKSKILTVHNKSKFTRTASGNSDDVLAKTYIKRYRKGQTKIFKIRRRPKVTTEDDYQPPEDQFLDKFIKRLNNNFRDESSSDNESVASISTPTSYITDETKSEVLSTGSRKLSAQQRMVREGINKLLSDRNLLFSRYSDRLPREFDRTKILSRVDSIISDILKDYERGDYPYFEIPTAHISNCVFENDRYQIMESPKRTIVTYKHPSSRIRFNLILLLLNKIRVLLVTGTKLTKREIYYQLKMMITTQGATDRAIADISRMLNVGVWALNLTAQKGMVYGKLKLVMRNGETINCNVPGTLVPKDVLDICEIQSDAYFILVVEKESIFNKLLEEDLPKRLTRPFILITGKGFPDLNTQLFLKKLWMIITVPVFILVDADPGGIAIMLTYRFGSVANAHVSDHLAIPKSRWMGVFPSEIPKLSLDHEVLSHKEVIKTKRLLGLQCVQENDKIKEQLETLLANGIKTGIEGLMKTETYLSHRYLSSKFETNDLI